YPVATMVRPEGERVLRRLRNERTILWDKNMLLDFGLSSVALPWLACTHNRACMRRRSTALRRTDDRKGRDRRRGRGGRGVFHIMRGIRSCLGDRWPDDRQK